MDIVGVFTFTSAVKAAAATKRPFGEIAAMLFFNWFVSTFPTILPVLPCQSIMSVPESNKAIRFRLYK